ncbi:MAG TPA: hypothetical protein VFX76_16185, partial [Roseiflexaceae bacterium]|nr:hypothetical protein [Roseiflexaceae bacterium]
CPICEDERQYVGPNGQQWTTLAKLNATHRNTFIEIDTSITGIRTEPLFGISQHAALIQTPAGNVLWEAISYLDDETVERVKALGGIAAISSSHPHMYASMVEWSRAFDAPIYVHADNRPWVMRPDDAIHFWEGETKQILEGFTLVRCGGHFSGSSVLHWAGGAEGRGALFTGDTIMVASDTRYVSFMYSYPNFIPLNARAVRGVVAAVEPFAFERLYSSWPGKVVAEDAKAAVQRSAERYIAHIQE